MNKMTVLAMILLGCVGCSGGDDVAKSADVPATTESPAQSIDWYQDDLSQAVEKVGADNVDDIFKSINITPHEISDSTDNQGEPKKIYILTDNPLSAQLEHSPNIVIIAWYQATDSIENSQKGLKDAYLLARAVLGKDGADVVRHISSGKKYDSSVVAGHAVSGACIGGFCVMNIQR